jgi:hypothetical protein
MSDTPPATKSAAIRIGLVPCPGCNPTGLPPEILTGNCAWCWNQGIGCYTRFVAVDVAIQYAQQHGEDFHDVPTPLEIPPKKV